MIKEFDGELRLSFESENHLGPSFSISYPGIQSAPQVFTWSLPSEKYDSLEFKEFLEHPDFIVGYNYHSDYVLWQTESIVDNYKVFNKPFHHLNLYWDEELQVNKVDVSNNPGRIEFAPGLVLLSCWRMYFGNEFFKYIPKNKILSFDGSHKIEEWDNGIIFVELYPDVFESESEENKERQRSFREWIGMDKLIS